VLKIPAVQWTNIPAGPVCVAQFQSPYPPFVPQPGATLPLAATAALPTNTRPPALLSATPSARPPVTTTNTLPPIIIQTPTPTRRFRPVLPLPTIVPPLP
jgi:hypothetical protein